MDNLELVALHQRLDAEAAKVGPDALRPSIEEWQSYFAGRGIPRTQANLDAAVVTAAGLMATTAALVQAGLPDKPGRVTARKSDDRRLALVFQGIRLSAVALSQVAPS